jgi:curved DNA-binding protein CbpA
MIDPYRTLGLEPGVAMAEVKRAYRRLAKAYHPDSAGEAALPRFLAIHEAYEAIRTGRPFMPGARQAPGARAASAASRAEPWRADPDRARAARDRARRRAGGTAPGAGAGPSGSARAGGTGTTGTAGGAGSGRSRTGGTGDPAGRSSAGGRTGTSGETRSRAGRRHVRKATMGSTSYDEARDPKDPSDPSWSGASWYGPSTGEYWIINPREYADPRKHGPEYQSRARRMAAAALGGDATEGAEIPTGTFASEAAPEPELGARRRNGASTDASSDPIETGTSAGRAARSFRAESRRRTAATARAEPLTSQSRVSGSWGTTWPYDARSIRRGAAPTRGLSPRSLVGSSTDDPVRRLGIALLAWPPIGLAAAALIGDVTGCTVYSADCGGTEPLLPWLAQAVILGLLLLLPPFARILAGGAIGVLVGLVPLTAFLVAVGGSGAPQAGFALAFFLGLAWLLGVGWAVAQARRRPAAARAGP